MTDRDRALRAFDVAAPEWRDAVRATVLLASRRDGRHHAIGAQRADAITDALLALIRDHGEDLEPLLADLADRTDLANLAAARSAGRVAALEHALGIERAIPGTVIPRPT